MDGFRKSSIAAIARALDSKCRDLIQGVGYFVEFRERVEERESAAEGGGQAAG